MAAEGSSSSPALHLQDVTVCYDAKSCALQGITLRVERGERVALLGPSGSGKTTILNVCAGIVAPTSGQIDVLAEDLSLLRNSERRLLRARVGMVHQQLHLVPPLKVIHNVNAGRLGQWSTFRALRSLVRPVELDESRAVLARLGIEDKVFSRVSALSGGQQQRVAMARVLRQQPELVLADEPVSAVDPSWSAEVLRLLGEEVRERTATLVVALHDVGLARQFCDRLIGVRGGRIVFDGSSAAVTDGQIEELYAFATPPVAHG